MFENDYVANLFNEESAKKEAITLLDYFTYRLDYAYELIISLKELMEQYGINDKTVLEALVKDEYDDWCIDTIKILFDLNNRKNVFEEDTNDYEC